MDDDEGLIDLLRLFLAPAQSPMNTPGSQPGKEECDRQWRAARAECRSRIFEQLQQRAGRRKKRSVTGVTGGYSNIEDCAKGLVSEECGGNLVDFGKR